MAVAPSVTSAKTSSRIDPASVIAFLLLIRSEPCYYMENKPTRETIHRWGPLGIASSDDKDTMKFFTCILLATAAFAGLSGAPVRATETIRLAVQKTGTFAWELAVIRAHGLDRQANLAIQVYELASPEAGKIALRGGSADVIVSDWLWVSRERGLGAKLTFYPYSSALGAVMVAAASPAKSLADLKGKSLGVAG